jgi:hypothetical protein
MISSSSIISGLLYFPFFYLLINSYFNFEEDIPVPLKHPVEVEEQKGQTGKECLGKAKQLKLVLHSINGK